jgi:hypothetical protein
MVLLHLLGKERREAGSSFDVWRQFCVDPFAIDSFV